MKGLLFGIIFLMGFSTYISAQNQRYFYQFKKKMVDSTGKDNSYKETMILDVGKKGSRFWSYEAMQGDSLKQAEQKGKILDPLENNPKWYKGSRYFVDKSYPDFKVNHINSISHDVFNLNDTRNPVWKILNETDKIEHFKVQKAEGDFMGRKWFAWFTTDIPIQDGPHKFRGLPGLILKIEDETGLYSFEFAGVKTIANLDFSIIPFYENSSTLIKVNFDKYKKVYQDYYVKGIFVVPNSGEGDTFYDIKGNKVSKEEFYKPIIEGIRKNAGKYKDIIDQELLK